jgi:hypothetical protein
MELHPVLAEFLDTWVYPTGFSGPGYDFRMHITQRCIPAWNAATLAAVRAAEEDAASPTREWLWKSVLAGYAGEGPQMSIKQMSTQLLAVSLEDQERYIDLQRMRAQQVWDEVKHGMLHADVLLRGGYVQREEDLMDSADANTLGILSYFGCTAMFPHIHPLARVAQHYFFEGTACLGIQVRMRYMNDSLDLHDNLSQYHEELMHFMEGKYQMDVYALTEKDQRAIEDTLDFLLKPWAPTLADALARAKQEAAA